MLSISTSSSHGGDSSGNWTWAVHIQAILANYYTTADFHLFCSLMESWYHLQGMKKEPDDGTRLEYLLNVLDATGQWKHEQRKPEGATEADHENTKKSAADFLKYLSSTMDHPMSQWCRIYQLEDVHIYTGETANELVECLCGLADHCGFPSDEEKERNIQYHFVHALSDSDLISKLLTLQQQLLRCWSYATHTLPSKTTWVI